MYADPRMRKAAQMAPQAKICWTELSTTQRKRVSTDRGSNLAHPPDFDEDDMDDEGMMDEMDDLDDMDEMDEEECVPKRLACKTD
jgi:hypothetical protein